jgi:hypothetical protein
VPSTWVRAAPVDEVRGLVSVTAKDGAELAPGGTIVDVCGGQPCRNFDYTP